MSTFEANIAAAAFGAGNGLRISYAERRAGKRREAAQRQARRTVVPVSAEARAADPLRREERDGGLGRIALFVAVGAAAHVALVVALVGLGGFGAPAARPLRPERVEIRVIEPPRIDPLPEQRPEPEIAPLPEPVPAQPIQREQRVRELAADPIAPTPPAAAPEAPPRRVVGLSLESTVTAGTGPAFAVGNTRMGATGDTAEDPRAVRPAGGGERPAAAGANAAADLVPASGAAIVKPKRLAEPRLDYPSALKAQGIEGDVGVLIRIGSDGTVSDVRVVKSSGVPELDAAARAAAEAERFSPATRDGAPIEYTLKYTYRFRIVQA